jgi:hypothetical protein
VTSTGRVRGSRAHRALVILPAVGLVVGIPFANRVEPYVLGLPFLLFWIVAWVVVTSAIMGFIWSADRRLAAREQADSERTP